MDPSNSAVADIKEVAPKLLKNLEAMKRFTSKFSQQWHKWIRSQKARRCEEHGKIIPVDVEASIRESFSMRENVALYGLCVDCQEQRQRDEKIREASRIGIPEDLAFATTKNWKPRTKADASALEVVKQYEARLRGILILMGPYGLGKSHLAAAIAMSAKRRNVRSWFVRQGDMLRALRESYSSSAMKDVVERARAIELLCIDDLGVSQGGRDEQPMLHEVLEHRHSERKPTVITTNFDVKQLAEHVGPRIYDRLRSSATVVIFSGESWRKSLRDQYLGTDSE